MECHICGDTATYSSNEGPFCYVCLGEHMIQSYGHIMNIDDITEDDDDDDSGTQGS